VVSVRWALLHVMEHTANHQKDIIFLRGLCAKRLYAQTYKTVYREIQVA
jgi:hypothetical protein